MSILLPNIPTPVHQAFNKLVELAEGFVRVNSRQANLPNALKQRLTMAIVDPKQKLGSEELDQTLAEFHKAVLQIQHGDGSRQVFSDEKVFELIERGDIDSLREVLKYQEFSPEHFVKAITSGQHELLKLFFDKRQFAFGINSEFACSSKGMITVLPYSYDRLYGQKFAQTDLLRVALDYLNLDALLYVLDKGAYKLGSSLLDFDIKTIPKRLVLALYENKIRHYIKSGHELTGKVLQDMASDFVLILQALKFTGFNLKTKDSKGKTILDYLNSHKDIFIGKQKELQYLNKCILENAGQLGLQLA